MRIFPSRRRGGGEDEEAGDSAIIRRRNSSDNQRGDNVGQDATAQSPAGGRPKKWSRFAMKTKTHATAPRTSPFALYANEELSPRSSAWLYLSAVSIAGLSSLLVTEKAIDEAMEEGSEGRSAVDSLIVVVLSISFALSLLITAAYRHRGLRERLTGDVRYLRSSLEFVLAVLAFCFWTIVLRYVTDPFSGLHYGLTMITVDGYEEVWNTNIWVCAWLGWGITSYLVGALLMAPKAMRSGVWTLGLGGVTSHSPHPDGNESDPSILASNVATNSVSTAVGSSREGASCATLVGREHSLALWFMLLSFSVALTAYSIVLRTGDACTNFLSTTPFCKRSSLGGAVGLSCALLALTAMAIHGMNQKGSFEQWPKKEKILPRIEATLTVLCLVLQGVNMGYGTSPSGPSTEMGNLFICTSLGVILSLMLCEQVASGNVPRVHPPRNEKSWVAADQQRSQKLRISASGGGGDGGGDDHSSSSSSSSSSDSSSSDSSRGASTHGLSTHDASTVQHNNESQDLEASNVAVAGPATQARREFISSKAKTKTKKRDKKLTSSGRSAQSSSTSSSSNGLPNQFEDATQETPNSYSLPQPPPIYASSPSQPSESFTSQSQSASMNRPFLDNSVPPPFQTAIPDNFTPDYSANQAVYDEDSEGDDSGVELEFVPEDDVSTLECSLMSNDTAQEPDGYKSDDVYDASSSTLSRTRSAKSKKSWRQNNASQRENALDPVEEVASVDLESNLSPKSPPKEQAASTIEEIMNRDVDDLSPTAKARLKEEEARARKMAQKFTKAGKSDDHSDSTNNEGGPPTVESAREDDEAVKSALKSRSFFSGDGTFGDSSNVYST